MVKASQIAWKIVPLRHFFPLKDVPLIEVLMYSGKVLRLILMSVVGTTSVPSDAIHL
jgi:hypothetical protein